MRLVLDTNVLISAFISHGVCHELLEHCIRGHQVITSEFILKEFQESLAKKFKMSTADSLSASQLLRSRLILVNPRPIEPVCRDRSDDKILATALAGASRCLISGDKDLLTLKSYKSIKILSPSAFWLYESQNVDK